MNDTLMKLHIEKPGTNYINLNGDVTSSSAGHMWFEVIRPNGTSFQAGFAPVDPKGGVSPVPGDVLGNDGISYDGDPHYTAAYRITEDQADILGRYVRSPSSFGFDKENYHALTNSCVDFVWKGLEEIGMNPDKYEGHPHPVKNMDRISTLNNPQMPDSGLVELRKTDDGVAGLEEQVSSPMNDMWSGTPNPWAHIIQLPDISDADLPVGTITISPLGPAIAVELDGSNYADGTSYQ